MGHKEEMLAYAGIIKDLDMGERNEDRITDFVNSLDGQGLVTWFKAACSPADNGMDSGSPEANFIIRDVLEERLRLLMDASSLNGVLLALRVG